MGGKEVLHAGPSSGTNLYCYLCQLMIVRGGLGVGVGSCLGAVCLANGVSGVVWLGLVAILSLICLCPRAIMPKSLVCARERSLLRSVFAILLS